MTVLANSLESPELRRTRTAYLVTCLLKMPFWAMYQMLPFILYKELNASAWQIAAFISLKPMASLFSLYWSSWVKKRSDRLLGNIVWATMLAYLPFLFCPFINNPWFFVLASGFYMMLNRGVIPAWMEIFKINMPDDSRKKIFAYGSTLSHIGGGLIPLIFGWLLDGSYEAWRWLFPLTASIVFFALIWQSRIPIKKQQHQESIFSDKLSIQHLWQPWVDAWNLIRLRPDFGSFQIGFMFGGAGLMVMKSVLPAFFMDSLHLSYTELAIALTLFEGIGYALAMPVWTQCLHKINLFQFSGFVTLLAAMYPLGLIAAETNISWLYLAYLIYGIMQAGSELSWNLSGPIFAKNEDSSTYSGVNVVSVGLRGCAAPPLGGILCSIYGVIPVLLFGGVLCLMGTWRMFAGNRKKFVQEI